MGLKPDHWIRKMALEQQMIEPYADNQARNGVISYGVSSYGYDIRLSPTQCLVLGRIDVGETDPKNFNLDILRPVELLEDQRPFNLIAAPAYPELIQTLIELNNNRKNTAFIVGDSPFRLEADANSLNRWANNLDLAICSCSTINCLSS